MTSNELNEILNKTRRTKEISLTPEQAEELVKDLEMLEELKNPYDEYETDDYFLTREAYYNENLGELCYAYTVYKWDGTYKEREIPITKKKMKFKNWVEESHAGCGTAKNDLKEYLENHLRVKKLIESKVR